MNDFTSANKVHFDSHAQAYDGRSSGMKLARVFGSHILASYTFDEGSTTILDFACGTGHVSRELAADAKRITGVDISQGMVDQFNLRVANQGIDAEEMQAICVDLLASNNSSNDLFVFQDGLFDVIVCCLGYHHFLDVDAVTRMLVGYLKPGGKLFVGDFEALEIQQSVPPSPRFNLDFVPHLDGFTQGDIQGVLERAGLEEIQFEVLFENVSLHGRKAQVFLASAEKAGS